MKRSTFFLVLPALLLLAASAQPVQLTMDGESRLWIDGTSTIHDWTCEVAALDGQVDAEVTETSLDAINGTSLTVQVEDMDCDNGTMNKKVRKALDADDNPTITFALTAAELSDDGQTVDATGNLTIAGETRLVAITADVVTLPDGGYRFTGSVPLTMTDFGIDPPKAMLGTLKTGDDITVRFDVAASR